MAAKDLLLHPIALLAAELATITLVVGFTPLSSAWRLALLPLLSAAVCASILDCRRHFHQHSLATFIAGQQATYLLQYIDVVLLDGWAFAFDPAQRAASGAPRNHAHPADASAKGDAAAGSPPSRLISSTGQQRSFWARLRFGWAACTAFRRCGTPFEINPLRPRSRYFSASSSSSAARSAAAAPPPSSPSAASSLSAAGRHTDDRGSSPRARDSLILSRAAYVRHALAHFCFCYLVLDLFDLAGRVSNSVHGRMNFNKALFAPGLMPFFARLGRVTAAQLAVRVASTCTGMLGAYCLINGVWNLYAAAAVGVFGADVRQWPPIFGRVREAYTLRRFWG